MSYIKISVIIPIYNVEKYIEQCLKSVVTQSLDKIEVICVDDGSTDNSCEIVRFYKKVYSNITIICQNNSGAGVARNAGIERAHGEYVCFMDPDDYYPDSNVLENLYNAANEHNALICGGNIYTDVEGGVNDDIVQDYYDHSHMIRYRDRPICFGHQRYLYARKLLKDNQYSKWRRFQDPPFMIRVMTAAEYYYVITDYVYVYRISHKVHYFSLQRTYDYLRGVEESLYLAMKYNYSELAEEKLIPSLKIGISMAFFYKSTELWNIILDIHNSLKSWLAINDKNIWTLEDYEEIYYECEKEVRYAKEIFATKKNIVIYGAGYFGDYLLNKFDGSNVIGIAVSNVNENVQVLNGKSVRQIEYYLKLSEDVFIIVALADDVQKKLVNQYLDEHGIGHEDFSLKNFEFYFFNRNIIDNLVESY